jgi:hypothetical protein
MKIVGLSCATEDKEKVLEALLGQPFGNFNTLDDPVDYEGINTELLNDMTTEENGTAVQN